MKKYRPAASQKTLMLYSSFGMTLTKIKATYVTQVAVVDEMLRQS